MATSEDFDNVMLHLHAFQRLIIVTMSLLNLNHKKEMSRVAKSIPYSPSFTSLGSILNDFT